MLFDEKATNAACCNSHSSSTGATIVELFNTLSSVTDASSLFSQVFKTFVTLSEQSFNLQKRKVELVRGT